MTGLRMGGAGCCPRAGAIKIMIFRIKSLQWFEGNGGKLRVAFWQSGGEGKTGALGVFRVGSSGDLKTRFFVRGRV